MERWFLGDELAKDVLEDIEPWGSKKRTGGREIVGQAPVRAAAGNNMKQHGAPSCRFPSSLQAPSPAVANMAKERPVFVLRVLSLTMFYPIDPHTFSEGIWTLQKCIKEMSITFSEGMWIHRVSVLGSCRRG